MSHSSQVLLVSSGDGPGECRQAVAHLLRLLEKDASRQGVSLDISERQAEHGPASAIVVLGGAGAEALSRAFEGTVLWRCPSSIRPRHKRKNWFVEIFRLDQPREIERLDPGDVEIQFMRAGGPGGQHQNKTESAVRARWRDPQGRMFSVVARDERSQHRNRKLAIARLQALVDADASEAAQSRQGGQHKLHHQVTRGAPHRVFLGPDFKPA